MQAGAYLNSLYFYLLAGEVEKFSELNRSFMDMSRICATAFQLCGTSTVNSGLGYRKTDVAP